MTAPITTPESPQSPAALRIRRSVSRLIRAGQALIYPPHCARCRHPIRESDDTPSRHLCPSCSDLLSPASLATCQRCSAPVGPHVVTDQGCPLCQSERWAFTRVDSVGSYTDNLKDACVQAKLASGLRMATGLTDLLWARHQTALQSAGYTMVVPVPHDWRVRLFRLHLCPETVARRLAWHLNIPCSLRGVSRKPGSPPQHSLSATQRRQNLKDVFRLSRNFKVSGHRILLVDDVLTTGTTVNRLARLLIKQGAQLVDVAVLGRAVLD